MKTARKILKWSLFFLVFVVISGWFFRKPLLLGFHKKMYPAARLNFHDQPWLRRFDQVFWLVSGKPAGNKFLESWEWHQEALVKRGFLTRREFVLNHQSLYSAEYEAFVDRVEKAFNHRLWSITSDGTNLVVTAPSAEMVVWESLIRDFDQKP